MMIVHDTYQVVVNKVMWRVSRPDLETFIHICLFNGCDEMAIKKEVRK